MNLLDWPGKIFRRFQRTGLAATLRYALVRIEEVTFDLRYNVKTSRGSLPKANEDQNGFGYWPALGAETRQMLNFLKIKPAEDVFLDFGSGLGRVLILASRYPFKRIIGVECGPELHSLAQKNVHKIIPSARCKQIDLVLQNAESYRLPNDVSIVYFNEPFGEEALLEVLNNVCSSLRENPRELTLVYRFPRTFNKVFPRIAWLEQIAEFRIIYKHVVCRARPEFFGLGLKGAVGS